MCGCKKGTSSASGTKTIGGMVYYRVSVHEEQTVTGAVTGAYYGTQYPSKPFYVRVADYEAEEDRFRRV